MKRKEMCLMTSRYFRNLQNKKIIIMIIVDVDCRAIAVAKKKFNKKSNQENKN